MSTATLPPVAPPATKSQRLTKAFDEGKAYGDWQVTNGRKTPSENYNRPNPYSSFAPGVECRIEWRWGYFSAFGLPSPQ